MKIKYTILGKYKFFIFTNIKYGLLTLYKILDSKVHPIISKDNQRLPKTAKDSQSKVSVSWCLFAISAQFKIAMFFLPVASLPTLYPTYFLLCLQFLFGSPFSTYSPILSSFR